MYAVNEFPVGGALPHHTFNWDHAVNDELTAEYQSLANSLKMLADPSDRLQVLQQMSCIQDLLVKRRNKFFKNGENRRNKLSPQKDDGRAVEQRR
jgi:hypothetical protein